MNKGTKKKLAYIVLFVVLPGYIIGVVSLISLFDRLNLWLELGIYIFSGMLWVLPFKFIFKGLATK